MNTTPNTIMSGGRVGIPNRGRVKRTRGLTMNRGHHTLLNVFVPRIGHVWRFAFKTIARCNYVLALFVPIIEEKNIVKSLDCVREAYCC